MAWFTNVQEGCEVSWDSQEQTTRQFFFLYEIWLHHAHVIIRILQSELGSKLEK